MFLFNLYIIDINYIELILFIINCENFLLIFSQLLIVLFVKTKNKKLFSQKTLISNRFNLEKF